MQGLLAMAVIHQGLFTCQALTVCIDTNDKAQFIWYVLLTLEFVFFLLPSEEQSNKVIRPK